MATFQDRIKEVRTICAPQSQNALINVHGEAGIGKSSLLKKAQQKLQKQKQKPWVILINLADIKAPDHESCRALLLEALLEQTGSNMDAFWHTQDNTGKTEIILAHLQTLARDRPLYMFYDTTEVFLEDAECWRWIEKSLVEPLITTDLPVTQVFAGRVPVLWRSFTARRVLQDLPLGPIEPDGDIRKIIKEAVQEQITELAAEDLETITKLVLDFSLSHPALSKQIATFVSHHFCKTQTLITRDIICKQIVAPFIEQSLFEYIEEPWKQILWWASVLERFDATILQRYLSKAAPALVENQQDYFFSQGIGQLRRHNILEWSTAEGDRLRGLIKDIVRHCLQILDPERYCRACLAAADTFEEIAQDLLALGEQAEANLYIQQAENYQHCAHTPLEVAA